MNLTLSRVMTHSQWMTSAARAMADRKTLAHLSSRVAARRQSFNLPRGGIDPTFVACEMAEGVFAFLSMKTLRQTIHPHFTRHEIWHFVKQVPTT